MKYKKIDDSPRTYVLIFSAGDELASELAGFAKTEKISDGSFKAVGALSSVKLAWFNPETKKYDTSVDLQQQVELLSLIGDIAEYNGEPVVHAHLVVGLQDGSTRGGHLQQATIRPTCELFLTEAPAHLRKKVDPATGLPLIAL